MRQKKMTLGKNLKQLRKDKNLTQQEFADRLFVSRQTISNWENDKSIPSMDFIVSICHVCDVAVDSLINTLGEDTADSLNINMTSESQQNEDDTEKKIIQNNKERVVFSRLLFFRFTLIWIGSFLTVYFLTSHRTPEYIYFSIGLLTVGYLISFPINQLKKKHSLNSRKDVSEFLDERYK